MHTYTPRQSSGSEGQTWDVYFDSGASDDTCRTIRLFKTEYEAAMFAHYMNGGEVDRLCLRRWFGDA